MSDIIIILKLFGKRLRGSGVRRLMAVAGPLLFVDTSRLGICRGRSTMISTSLVVGVMLENENRVNL